MMTDEITYEGPDAFPDAERDDAKAYWSGIGVRGFYTNLPHWSLEMAERVMSFGPARVLEFGCNAGRNLHAIDQLERGVELIGLDINAEAVEHGREAFGLDLRHSDEASLADMPDDAVDVSFTISVLDHVPYPAEILRELVRVSSSAVILLEPELGIEGRVERDRLPHEDEPTEATPYSYSWDYDELIASVCPSATVHREPHVLKGSRWGPYYHRFEIDLRQGGAGSAPAGGRESSTPSTVSDAPARSPAEGFIGRLLGKLGGGRAG